MKKISTLLITTLLTASLFANDNLNKEIELGEKISHDLIKTLGKNMKQHLKGEGLVGAMKFCNESAYTLTQSVNDKYAKNISIKRISLKTRSEANRASQDEVAVLESLEKLQSVHATPKYIIQESKNSVKFYKPLTISKAVCLKCHGTVLNKESTQFLKEHYPNDKAINYKMDDLRGAVVVTFKK